MNTTFALKEEDSNIEQEDVSVDYNRMDTILTENRLGLLTNVEQCQQLEKNDILQFPTSYINYKYQPQNCDEIYDWNSSESEQIKYTTENLYKAWCHYDMMKDKLNKIQNNLQYNNSQVDGTDPKNDNTPTYFFHYSLKSDDKLVQIRQKNICNAQISIAENSELWTQPYTKTNSKLVWAFDYSMDNTFMYIFKKTRNCEFTLPSKPGEKSQTENNTIVFEGFNLAQNNKLKQLFKQKVLMRTKYITRKGIHREACKEMNLENIPDAAVFSSETVENCGLQIVKRWKILNKEERQNKDIIQNQSNPYIQLKEIEQKIRDIQNEIIQYTKYENNIDNVISENINLDKFLINTDVTEEKQQFTTMQNLIQNPFYLYKHDKYNGKNKFVQEGWLKLSNICSTFC